MLDSVSPYALLKSSKPKPPSAYVTAYDLYSAAQQSAVSVPAQYTTPSAVPAVDHDASMPQQSTLNRMPQNRNGAKTHYIADIKTRHSRAAKHTQMTGASLFSQTPPSVQTPPT